MILRGMSWKEFRSQEIDPAQYGKHRARLVIQEAEKLPLNDALHLLRNRHKTYSNLGKGIPAYGIAADLLLKAQADIVVKHVSMLHPLRITEKLKQWEEYYRNLSMSVPAYSVVVNELMIAEDVWKCLLEG
jgi:hypothetical protein